MSTKATVAVTVTVVAVLTIAACSSGSSTTATSPSTTTTAAGGAPPGGALQTFTAVNLNNDGASPGGANTPEVARAVGAFLATLDATQRGKVEHAFDDHQARQTWSNYPSAQVPREGIALSDLNDAQRQAVESALRAALSPQGVQQNTEIRAADDYLRSLGGQGADGFGAANDYYVALYGAPSPTQPFVLQFGGHHLARNLTYNGERVSQTPQFVGSEPTSFPANGVTVEPVKAEATAMFGIMSGLTAEQRAGAQITSGTFDDLLMGPTKDSGNFPAPEGLPVAQLAPVQQQAVMAAIEAYAGDLPGEAGQRLLAKYRSELDRTRVGWSNNTGPSDESSYIRVDGPSVWIEFINTRSRSTPNIHYHSVYRDKTNDYGSSKPS